MGKETVYCSVCGDRIPNADLVNGKAAMVLRKYYCRACGLKVVKQSAEPNHDPTVTPHKVRVRPRREPLANMANKRRPMIIATAVGIIALLLLLYMLFAKQS